MTRHPERYWNDYTCPHCGENIWDADGSVTDSYVEDDYYIQEISCGCGAEVRYYNRIDDYPSYVDWNDSHCEQDEEQDEEQETGIGVPIATHPVDNSPIEQSRAIVSQLRQSIAATRAQRDMLVHIVDSLTPESRNSSRMSPELIQQWRTTEKRKRYLELEEKIEALCQDLQREQAILDKLEQNEFERLAQDTAPPIITTKDLANVYSKLMAESSRQ